MVFFLLSVVMEITSVVVDSGDIVTLEAALQIKVSHFSKKINNRKYIPLLLILEYVSIT